MYKAFWTFHAAFFAVCAGFLIWQPLNKGYVICGLVLAYNIALPLWAKLRGDRQSLRLYAFLLPLSVLMVLPDHFLAANLGILSFSQYPVPYLGRVPIFMAGMWVIPLFMAVRLGLASRYSSLMAGFIGLAIFAGAEFAAPWLGFWQPHHVQMLGGMALYILPAEFWLAAASAFAFQHFAPYSLMSRTFVAAGLMMSYIGAAALGHSFIS